MGGDLSLDPMGCCAISFNPRPRMGGDSGARPRRTSAPQFQSTPPYGGRRSRPEGPGGRRGVSIHAPVWGATFPRPSSFSWDTVSIHAPVWGATARFVGVSRSTVFQSTPPYGGRPEPHPHAQAVSCFNPRPRMGGDLGSVIRAIRG